MIRAREEVAAELAKVPRLRYTITADRIRIEPMETDGFPAELSADEDGRYTVSFAEWHETFDEEASALDCLFTGLSADCRLEVVSHGGVPSRWTMEVLKGGTWRPYSTTGRLLFPFWKQREVRHLQNLILEPPGEREPEGSQRGRPG